MWWDWYCVYREFSEVCILSGLSRKISLATVFTGILFYPLIMYCSFVYGNIWGLALSLLAIRFALQFLQQHRCRYAVLAALAILAGICFKFNYIIFLIGILLYAVVETIRQKKVKLLLLPVLLIISILIQSMLPVALARQVTGDPMDRGASTWAWAAMGLQREGPFCPGWYNNYDVYSYWDSEENPQVQSELAKQNLADSIGFFSSHPGEALRFFTVKTASQWNNPTFQCYWITQNPSASFQQSSWVSWFTSENGNGFGNILFEFASIRYFGWFSVVLCIVLERSQEVGFFNVSDDFCGWLFIPYCLGSKSTVYAKLFCIANPICNRRI